MERVVSAAMVVLAGGYVVKYLLLLKEIGTYPSVLDILKKSDFLAIDGKHAVYGFCVLATLVVVSTCGKSVYKWLFSCGEGREGYEEARHRHRKNLSLCDLSIAWVIVTGVLVALRRIAWRDSTVSAIEILQINFTNPYVNYETIPDFVWHKGGAYELDLVDLVIASSVFVSLALVFACIRNDKDREEVTSD